MSIKRGVASGLNGWAAIGVVVLGFDLLALWNQGETLTDAYRRHGVFAHVILGVTGLHLLGFLPKRLDPFSTIAVAAAGLSSLSHHMTRPHEVTFDLRQQVR